MKRDTMLFYNEWRKAISELPVEKRCEVYEALFEYAFENKLPEDALIKAITHIMRIKIDSDQNHYNFKCQKNKENAKKGGRPKKEEKTERFSEKPNGFRKNRTDISENRIKPTGFSENPYMIYDNMIYDDKDKSLSNKDANASSPSSVETVAEIEKQPEGIDWEKFKIFFNSEMQKHNSRIPKISKLSKERKTAVLARMKDFDKESIFQVIQKSAVSDFLNGRNDRGWKADFEWIFRPSKFPKILEGTYDNDDLPTIQITQQFNGTTSNHRNASSTYEQRQTEFARHIADKLTSPDPELPDLSGNY